MLKWIFECEAKNISFRIHNPPYCYCRVLYFSPPIFFPSLCCFFFPLFLHNALCCICFCYCCCCVYIILFFSPLTTTAHSNRSTHIVEETRVKINTATWNVELLSVFITNKINLLKKISCLLPIFFLHFELLCLPLSLSHAVM